MELSERLALEPVAHPSVAVQRAGFPIDHPYVEHCWAPTLGPTSVLVLRRVAALWREQTPAVVSASELGRMVGVGPGTGPSSTLARTFERLERFRFVAPERTPGRVGVYTAVPPRLDRHLRHLPTGTRRIHEELLDEHLSRLAQDGTTRVQQHATEVSRRLDDLQRPTPGLDRSLNR